MDRRPPLSGLVVGLLLGCASLTPSLVPRSWLLQGAVTGVSAAVGYGLGALLGTVSGAVLPRQPGPRATRLAWRVAVGAGTLLAVTAVLLAGTWQRQLHVLTGAEEPAAPAYVAVLAVAAVVVVTLIATARSLRVTVRAVGGRLRRWLPPRTATVTAAVAVTLAGAMALQGLLAPTLFGAADRSFRALNEAVAEEVPRPDAPHVSGGPGSLTTWEELGTQGRKLIARTPTVDDLARVARARGGDGDDLLPPIRVYVGLDAAADPTAGARLAVDELERTGAFDREVLAVMAATGTGWVNPTAAEALEHLTGGDSALVSLQYSYLPSWLSFLVDRERAAEAGSALFDAVHAHWVERDPADRPRLVVYGESLGSYAVERTFADVDALRARTDGVVLVGPPAANPLRRSLLAEREPGTPAHRPVVDGGRTVRFAAQPGDLAHPDGAWAHPRVVYLQHASDPVAWWSPRLLLRRPDWLREPRGDDVLPAMRWFPVVTFWQLSADLAHADEVPPGHGHDYGTRVLDAWAAVLDPAGWSADDLEVLRDWLERRPDPAE